MKRSDMCITLKTTLAKKNSEMEKLEKSKKAHLRMISSSGAKLKMKHNATDEVVNPLGDLEAKNIRMYETHVPGFCYLRNGECRKRITSTITSTTPDPIQCSEMVKGILFTDNELDIYKTMCLHLLGTHVQNKKHIQRKDGRLCSYVKAQAAGNLQHTLQPFSHRVSANVNKTSTKYDKMLPRYILDVKSLRHDVSSSSVKMCDFDSGSDEETKKKRKLQVPVYINNEIRMIVHSVMEALETVNSSKFICLINLASSPEELRNMLKNEDLQDFIMELSGNPLVVKPTSYDFVMTHLMFDRIPEKGTLESVAQVLEIYDNTELQKSIYQIQRAILHRHNQLTNTNGVIKSKIGFQEKSLMDTTRTTTPTVHNSGIPSLITVAKKDTSPTQEKTEKNLAISGSRNEKSESVDIQCLPIKPNTPNKSTTRNVSINVDKILSEDQACVHDNSDYDENPLLDENRGSFIQRTSSIDSNKYSFQNLSNPHRILFGLKVASLKSKPINQFEGKKKIDLAAILAPILCPQDSETSAKNSMQSHNSLILMQNRKVKKSSSNISEIHTNDLENLTRALLANLRLDISETENKKRVTEFMASI